MNEKIPCVYILANKQNGTLYVGVTSKLPQRIKQHKDHTLPGFTDRYNVTMLVYYEVCDTMESAITREKQINYTDAERRCMKYRYVISLSFPRRRESRVIPNLDPRIREDDTKAKVDRRRASRNSLD